MCYRAGGGEGGKLVYMSTPKISFIFSINQSIQIFIFIFARDGSRRNSIRRIKKGVGVGWRRKFFGGD
jgi:hypothetical protein